MPCFHHLFDEGDSSGGVAFGDVQDLSGLSNYEWIAGVRNREQEQEFNCGQVSLEHDAGYELVSFGRLDSHELPLGGTNGCSEEPEVDISLERGFFDVLGPSVS